MPGRARGGAKAPVRPHGSGARVHARGPAAYATAPVEWAPSARHRVSETGEQLWQGARDAGDRASYYGRRVRRGFFDTLHEQPLVLGALGLAAGAAIGAALPATEKEDEWLGDSRDRLDGARQGGRLGAGREGACGRGRRIRRGARGGGAAGADPGGRQGRCRVRGGDRAPQSRAGRGGGDRGRQDRSRAAKSRSHSAARTPEHAPGVARCIRFGRRSPSATQGGGAAPSVAS